MAQFVMPGDTSGSGGSPGLTLGLSPGFPTGFPGYGGAALGGVSTDHRMPPAAPPSWPIASPGSFINQGQMRPYDAADAAITTSMAFDDSRPGGGPTLPMSSARGQMVFARSVTSGPLSSATNRPGPHSGMQESRTLSQLNFMLSSKWGQEKYAGRCGSVVTREWRFVGVANKDYLKPREVRGLDFAKRTEMCCIFPGRDLQVGSGLFLILVKVKTDSNDGVGLPSVLPAATEMKEWATEAKAGTAIDVLHKLELLAMKARIPSARVDIPGEHWRLVPIACEPGRTPDVGLYCNDYFTGDCMRIGEVHHFKEALPLLKAHETMARAAAFPTETSNTWLKALVECPKMQVMLIRGS